MTLNGKRRFLLVGLLVGWCFASPCLAQTPPDILGTYHGAISIATNNCADPEDEDVFVLSGTTSVDNQTSGTWDGTGQFTGAGVGFTAILDLTLTAGTVDADGNLGGDYSYAITVVGLGVVVTSNGTFTGRSTPAGMPDRIWLLLVGTDSDGCTVAAGVGGCRGGPCARFREHWDSVPAGTGVPDTVVPGDEGGWILADTVSEFPSCAPVTPQRGEILFARGSQVLELRSVDSNSGCSDNVWAVRAGLSLPIDPTTVLSFLEEGSLDSPQPGSPGCIVVPCGDTVSLLLQDDDGNVLAYILQREPSRPAMPVGSSYVEILLDPDARTYTRNLFDDFNTIPAFDPVGAQLVSVEFKLQEHGTATIDAIVIDDTSCQDYDGDGNLDDDADALCDNWEVDGIDVDGDMTADLTLSGADPEHKDLYVEIDWMQDHRPLPGALDPVVAAFAAAGIRLHLDEDEQAIAHHDSIGFRNAGTPHFDQIKANQGGATGGFGTAAQRMDPETMQAKALAYRYALFAHHVDGTTRSGIGELGGNDLVVSLGSYTGPLLHPTGDAGQQAAIFMHELGHNLGLRHGGFEDRNCKPNYVSIMNYSRLMDGIPVPGRALDYSAAALPALDETDLTESIGIQGAAGVQVVHGPWSMSPPPVVPPASAVLLLVPPAFIDVRWVVLAPGDGPADWSLDGDFTDSGVAANIRNLGIPQDDDCNGIGGLQVLGGHDDWANLQLGFRDDPDAADGVHLGVPEEPDLDSMLTLSPDSDGDGAVDLSDNCPAMSNPMQDDTDSDDRGDACDCAPLDAGTWAVPLETAELTLDADATTLRWTDAAASSGTATVYDVVRGVITELPVGSGASEVCLDGGGIATTSVADVTVPSPGTAFFYVVRGSNPCGDGSYGTDSGATPRVTPICP